MKKILCMVLAALLLLSLCACGGEEKPRDPAATTTASGTEDKKPEKETEKTSVETDKDEEELQEIMFPLVEMYCEVPEEYSRKTNGSIAVTVGRDEFIATIFNGASGAYTGELEGILDFSAEMYANDVNKYLAPNIEAGELKAGTTEKVTVSGYDAVKFSGTVKNIGDGTYEIYGYSMIIEDRPVMFVGILCSEDQAKADLEEMQALVDLMAGSIYK